MIDDAEKAAKSLHGLIGNILDFSRIESGKIISEVMDINPTSLVMEAVDILQSVARQNNIFITATFSADIPETVRGDGAHIRQILLNLIGNAVKYTRQGGINVRLMATDVSNNQCILTFEVLDSGLGFDQIKADRLFEPFVRDDSVVNWTEGTGLGLSISNCLVKLLGGTISCKSVSGHGSRFWFTMPVAVLNRSLQFDRPDLSKHSVLIYGDDCTAKRLDGYLKARGAYVTQCHSLNGLGYCIFMLF